MYGGPHTYANYRERCDGESPRIGRDSSVDWSHCAGSADQARIEAVLDTMVVPRAALLHVGVGNSGLAERFVSRTARSDGLTVSRNEKAVAESLGLDRYTVHILNKHSQEFGEVITGEYDLIIDNNLASYACCRYHFHLMLDSYMRMLKPRGKILTDQAGMDWYDGELG